MRLSWDCHTSSAPAWVYPRSYTVRQRALWDWRPCWAAAGLLAVRLPFRQINWLVAGVGLCALLGGVALAVPVGAMGQYGALVILFCIAQAMACTFSIFAVSAIQQRTPEHMTGKVMACVSAISMCAQPLGQLAYGLWFDISPGWLVLVVSGVSIFVLGVGSRRLFKKW